MTQEIIYLLIASSGGSAVIVGGMAAFLGKIWSARLEEATKSRYAAEIEHLKNVLTISQAQTQRNTSARFELYRELWSTLQDLKLVADRLWNDASIYNFQAFIEALRDSDRAIEKGRLILAERDYFRLRQAIDAFQHYRLGKAYLIEIRSELDLRAHYELYGKRQVNMEIKSNQQSKENYEEILNEVVVGFRSELGLDA